MATDEEREALVARLFAGATAHKALPGYDPIWDEVELVAATIARLTAEVRRKDAEIARLSRPTMFWQWDDGESVLEDWNEPLDYCPLGDVVHIECGAKLPDRWVTTRCLSVDDAGDPDDAEAAWFSTEAEAKSCWPDSLAAASALANTTEEGRDHG